MLEQHFIENQKHKEQEDDDVDQFPFSPQKSPSQSQGTEQPRVIRSSLINKSCMHVSSYSCKMLEIIPSQISESGYSSSQFKLQSIQKLDLSYNSLKDIGQVDFEQLKCLKQLIVNDNQLQQIPNMKLNMCKYLRVLLCNNNRITLLPYLSNVAVFELKNNPVKLVTSKLNTMNSIQYIVFDWLELLVDVSNAAIVQYDRAERLKQHIRQYQSFRYQLVDKVNFQEENNRLYCDFHTFFVIRMRQNINKLSNTVEKDKQEKQLISKLIHRTMFRPNSMFIKYLKSYYPDFNYPSLVFNKHYLLVQILQNNLKQTLQLFKLKKSHYSQAPPQFYLQILSFSCRYSNYDYFRFLLSISDKRDSLGQEDIRMLVKDVIERFEKQKGSDKMLEQLVNRYHGHKIVLDLPEQYNAKIYKNMSYAFLYILEDQQLRHKIAIQKNVNQESKPVCVSSMIMNGGGLRKRKIQQPNTNLNKGAPLLQFAMKSRNQDLVKLLLGENDHIFERSEGLTSKFVVGSTQMSRKMAWKAQKNKLQKLMAKQKEHPFNIQTQNQRKSIAELNKMKELLIIEDQIKLFIPKKTFSLESVSDYKLQSQIAQDRFEQDVILAIEQRLKNLQNSASTSSSSRNKINVEVIIFLLKKLSKNYKKNKQFFTELEKQIQKKRKLTELYDYIIYYCNRQEMLAYEMYQSLENLNCEYLPARHHEVKQGYGNWCCQVDICE